VTRRAIDLFVNPTAGAKRGSRSSDPLRDPEQLCDQLTRLGLDVDFRVLEPEDDLTELARATAARGSDVVVAGGDGTAAGAATGLVGSEATLGIIPFGTFNNIARGMGLPLEPADAVQRIGQGSSTRVDVGLAWQLKDSANLSELSPPTDSAVFFEAVGAGLDAAGFGLAKLGEGQLWTALTASWRVLSWRKRPISLRLDGRAYRAVSPAVVVCNGPYLGLGFALAPNADASDGQLDVVIFRRMSRLQVLRHFLSIAGRQRHREPRVEIRHAQEVVILGGADPLPVHADGESIGTTPIAVVVRPGALRLFR